jgi:MoaA/NifB/PqqE/SkfB family radical SAM enzyme
MNADAVRENFPQWVGTRSGRAFVAENALALGPEFLRALKDENLKRLKAAEAEGRTDLPAYPSFVTIATTSKCNIRCEFCINQFDATPDNRFHMPRDMKDRVFAEVFPYVRKIALSVAGEPLFDPDFIQTVRLAKRYGIEIEMTSNGLLLGRTGYTEAILECVHRINFSIDGGVKETFERLRPGASWDRVMTNVSRLMQMRRDSGSPFPEVNIRYILMKENIEELPLMVDIAADLGVNSLFTNHLQVFLPFMREQSLLLHPRVANAVFDKARERAAARGLNVVLPDPFTEDAIAAADQAARAEAEAAARAANGATANVDEPLPPAVETVAGQVRPREDESTHYRNRCPYLWDQAFFEADGNVFPCCNSNVSMGRMQDVDEFFTLWNGPTYQDIRAKVYTRDCYGICKHCYLREGVRIDEDREAYVRV